MTNISKKDSNSFLMNIEYKNILDAMTESIWIGDENERTVYANPNFCNLLEYTLEEMIGQESYVFWDEESKKKKKKNNSLRKKGENSKYEWVLRSKSGKLIPVLLSGTPLWNGGTAGIMTDLREIQAVKNESLRLQELNQLKDEFISLVWHELRTPMTGIHGYLSMIKDGDTGEISEQTRNFLNIVINESQRLIEMVNDMLDIAKLEAGKMDFKNEPISPVKVGHLVIEGLTLLAKQRWITLVYENTKDIENITIYGDTTKLRQVLINLIGNAIKFTNIWWTITLKLTRKDQEILFEVIDTGIGIPEEHLHTIFEKFKQINNYLEKSISGTGLGLYICKKILSHFGSDLHVSSIEWKWSNFYFSIPVTS